MAFWTPRLPLSKAPEKNLFRDSSLSPQKYSPVSSCSTFSPLLAGVIAMPSKKGMCLFLSASAILSEEEIQGVGALLAKKY